VDLDPNQDSNTSSILQFRTTKGWDICIEWRDGSSISWHPWNKVKTSFPLQLEEYAMKYSLQDELTFKLWIKDALCHKTCMIKAAQTRYARLTHTFGI
jgi:hypothetical protein